MSILVRSTSKLVVLLVLSFSGQLGFGVAIHRIKPVRNPKPSITANQPISAAVGVMATLNGGDFILLGPSVYQFNMGEAASLFSAAPGRVTDCESTYDGSSCPTADAPTPPRLGYDQIKNTARAQSCTMISGGTLSGTKVETTFTAGSGKTARRYAVEYQISAKSGTVDPFTAWDLAGSYGWEEFAPAGRVATEYVTIDGTTPTYAFSAAVGLDWAVSISSLTVDGHSDAYNAYLRGNYAGCAAGSPCAWDFDFEATAASGAVSLIRNGDARTILNSDASPSNDNGGWQSQYQQEVVFEGSPVSLEPGDHMMTIRGTVLGGPSFTTTSTVRIMPRSCYAWN